MKNGMRLVFQTSKLQHKLLRIQYNQHSLLQMCQVAHSTMMGISYYMLRSCISYRPSKLDHIQQIAID